MLITTEQHLDMQGMDMESKLACKTKLALYHLLQCCGQSRQFAIIQPKNLGFDLQQIVYYHEYYNRNKTILCRCRGRIKYLHTRQKFTSADTLARSLGEKPLPSWVKSIDNRINGTTQLLAAYEAFVGVNLKYLIFD